MALSGPDSGRKRALAEINVTPLVDVMLVLLVIFMVTAPMLTHSLDVKLPEVAAREVVSDDEAIIEIAIRADGRISVDGELLPTANPLDVLGPLLERRKSQPLYLEADRNVPYGRVAEVIGLIQRSGIQRMHLVTEPPR